MPLKRSIPLALAAALLTLATAGCGHKTGTLAPWPGDTDPIVFLDAFPANVVFQAFAGSKYDAVSVDSTDKYAGRACLKIHVPSPGDPTGTYAGGAFTANGARDLSGYDALTFWAKASRAVTLDVAGLGNDNTGTSKYEAKLAVVPLTTTWTKIVVPIPLATRLTAERGLFFFAAGPQLGTGYDMWFDEIRFERLGTITHPRPFIGNQTVSTVAGATIPITGTKVAFAVSGVDEVVQNMPGYFTYLSSNPSVATVSGGAVHVVGAGTATITARLDTTTAVGSISITATAPPSVAAPAPTVPSADVISLYSDAYTGVPVDTWSATWDLADVADVQIAGNPTKLYSNLTYAGIEFTTHEIDATAMTAFHLDVWAPAGSMFKVKLVDFGADGAFGGGDDSQYELTYTAATTPAFTTGTWVPLEIPLSDFTGLTSRAHLAQLILSGDTRTVYVDNVYFHH